MLRLWAERSKDHLGARFKIKMVVGAMAISLFPILFMFFVSYSLLNRTLGRWFPRPLEIASEQTQFLLNDLGRSQIPRLPLLGHQLLPYAAAPVNDLLQHAFSATPTPSGSWTARQGLQRRRDLRRCHRTIAPSRVRPEPDV